MIRLGALVLVLILCLGAARMAYNALAGSGSMGDSQKASQTRLEAAIAAAVK